MIKKLNLYGFDIQAMDLSSYINSNLDISVSYIKICKSLYRKFKSESGRISYQDTIVTNARQNNA